MSPRPLMYDKFRPVSLLIKRLIETAINSAIYGLSLQLNYENCRDALQNSAGNIPFIYKIRLVTYNSIILLKPLLFKTIHTFN